MMYKRTNTGSTYQAVRRVIKNYALAAFFGVGILSSCSQDENEEPQVNSDSFFKISVAVEEFGEQDVNTRGGSTFAADTIVTPVNNDLYMETVIETETPAQGSTRAWAGVRNSNVTNTYIWIDIYDSNDKYFGEIDGKIDASGNFKPSKNIDNILPAGKYTFVCFTLNDVTVGGGDDDSFYYAEKGRDSRLSTIKKTIKPTDKDCYLSFVLQHKVGQAKIVVRSEAGDFSGLTAKLMSSGEGIDKCPSLQLVNIPDLTYGEFSKFGPLDEEICSSANGKETTHAKPIYLLGGEGYDYSAKCGAKVEFSAGSINGISLAGKSVALSNFIIQSRVITKTTVTFKRNPAITVNFNAGEGGTVTPTTFTGKTGDVVTATATPNVLYTLEGWYKGTTKLQSDANTTISGNSITLKLNSDFDKQTITGKFARIPSQLISRSAYRRYEDGKSPTWQLAAIMIGNGCYFDDGGGPLYISNDGSTTRRGVWIKTRNLDESLSTTWFPNLPPATDAIRYNADYIFLPLCGVIWNRDNSIVHEFNTSGIYHIEKVTTVTGTPLSTQLIITATNTGQGHKIELGSRDQSLNPYEEYGISWGANGPVLK